MKIKCNLVLSRLVKDISDGIKNCNVSLSCKSEIVTKM